MQTNVQATAARCYTDGMTQADTVAYILIHHCCGELPPFRTKQRVTEYVADYFTKQTQNDGCAERK